MKKYDRHSIRLKGYDYSCNGLYFVTICVQNRKLLFGNISENQMELNDVGAIIQQEWENIAQRFSIILHEYVIMPNHFHAVIELVGAGLCSAREMDCWSKFYSDLKMGNWAEQSPAPTGRTTVGDVVCAFKSLSTKRYNQYSRNISGSRLWQRNYYEHIIRDYGDYDRIIRYIRHNPGRWEEDRFYER